MNLSDRPVTEGRCPTEYNGTGIRFQDPKTNKWFYATFEVIPSSFEEFKKSVRHPSGVKYVVHWNSPYGPHCVYSREWLPKEGKVKCMNSWGKVEEEPLLRPDQIAEFYSVVLVVQEQNEDGSARMSDKALTSQQMPKLQAAFASIVRSSPEGVTALMRDGYLEEGSKPLDFGELPTPVLSLLREVNPKFEGTTEETARKWFTSAREKESLVVMGLLSAAPADTEPKRMLAKPTSRMLAELKRFEPKTTKKWLENGDFLIELLEKLCSIDIKKDVHDALLSFHDPYDRAVVCGSLPSEDLPEILNRQPRGWFSPATVAVRLNENINGFDSTATFAVPLEFVEFVEAQLLEMRKGKQLSVKGARLKEKLYSRTWETFAYTIVSAILEDLVNAIVGPKAALAKEIKWNETVEIARLVEVVAWEQGVLLEDKTSAKDWRGKAPRAGGSRDVDEEESPAKRTRRSPGSNY